MKTVAFICENHLAYIESCDQVEKMLGNIKIVYFESVQQLICNGNNIKPDLIIIGTNKNFFRAQNYDWNRPVKIALCFKDINRNQLNELLTLNIDGLLVCDMTNEEIANAIETILAGESYLHPKIAEISLTRQFA